MKTEIYARKAKMKTRGRLKVKTSPSRLKLRGRHKNKTSPSNVESAGKTDFKTSPYGGEDTIYKYIYFSPASVGHGGRKGGA